MTDLVMGDSRWLASEDARRHLIPVPYDADDVCSVCRSWKFSEYAKCSNCAQAEVELGLPLSVVVPITLYSKPSVLRDWLKWYKPNPEHFEKSFSRTLAAILWRYMLENGPSLEMALGGWDDVVVVPSTLREPPHPFKEVIQAVSSPLLTISDCLVRGPGLLNHRCMSEDAFLVDGDVDGRRILLLDDVFTSGARSQSAAFALSEQGAAVVGALVLARRINPTFNEVAQRVWDRQSSQSYDYELASAWLRAQID